MSVKPWWQVAVPHKDIREGRLEEAIFAANLGDVYQNKGPIDYRDPEIFFKRTYFTAGLTNLIGAVLSKLSGKGKGDTVIQIQTPFGGGKTHALLALYHTFKHGNKIAHLPTVKKILKENKIESIPETKVVVFVGEYADPLKGRTLWGEIAYQLKSYKLMEEYDKKRVAPGKELIADLLSKNQPVLILIDELLQYVVRTMGVKVEEGTLKGQVQAFLKALTEAVASADNCALIATLPSSVSEGFEEAEKAERILGELQKIFGRVEKIYTPVEGEEIYEIVRKRLFEELGNVSEHRKVAEEYFSLYQKLGEDIPSECREVAYKERMVRAYPFHPETIDILFERWATIPTFQRTRGALRLLAEVVADLFKREHSAPLIQPAHINLANSAIRREFIKHIGNAFEGVVASDVDGPTAKAPKIDREMGTEYAKFKVATGLATSIFFYSFSGGERKGVTTQRLRLAFLRQGIPATIVTDALRRLEDELWFLHFEKNFYYFSNVVGLNRVVIDKEEAIKDEDIEAEIRKRIEKIAGTDFDVYIWPKTNSDIPDNKKLKLIVLPPQYTIKDHATEKFVQNIINKYSTGFRTYKNTLMFLITDPNEYEGFKRITRRFLALDAIKTDKETMKRLVEEDKERVEQKLKDADTSLSIKLLSAYRYLAKASKDGIQTFDLGIPTIGEKPTLTKRTKEYLKDQEVILTKLSPKVLLEKTFSKEDERKNITEIYESFLKYPDLPIIENENVLKETIAQGVQTGTFGLAINEEIHYCDSITFIELTEETQIVRKEIAQKIKEETEKPPTPGEGLKPSTPVVPTVTTAPGKETITKLTLKANVPWDKLSDLMRGVFMPLNQEGAQINLEIKIEAQSTQGISKNTLDLKIKETLNQIGAKITEEQHEQ
jgi:predicted AAA+ superfamily ATPase